MSKGEADSQSSPLFTHFAKIACTGIKSQGYNKQAGLSAFSGWPGLDILSDFAL
jgi:hypothetical protein